MRNTRIFFFCCKKLSYAPPPPPPPVLKSFLKKLIICYTSSSATNIAEVSVGFHQADWSTTLGIVYCYAISFLFWFILFTCLSELDSNNKRADENVSSI